MPKQTLSRRIAELEAELQVPLIQRTTRSVQLTEAGVTYAARCQEIARLAREANEFLSSQVSEVSGLLRLTADFTFGETRVWPFVSRYLERYPSVRVDVTLTNRYVDLVEEGIDVAFRVGRLKDASLMGRRLGPAALVYCASPSYLASSPEIATPEDLARHAIVDFARDTASSRWPFFGPQGMFTIPVRGRVRVNSLALARRSALDGFGITNLPAFAAREDLKRGALVQVLPEWTKDIGAVHVIYPRHRFLLPRVRHFIDLVFEKLSPTEL